jgi:hypothetical protein
VQKQRDRRTVFLVVAGIRRSPNSVIWQFFGFDDFHASLGTRNVFDHFLAVPRDQFISSGEFFRSGPGFGLVGLLHVGDERVPSSFHETDASACLFVEMRERAV